MHPDYQAAVLAAHAEDTERTETFSVMWPDAPHRVLRSCIEAAQRAVGDTVGIVSLGGRQMPVPRLDPQTPIRATGDIAAMPLYAGHGVSVVRQIRPAAEIVDELVDGAARLLARRHPAGGLTCPSRRTRRDEPAIRAGTAPGVSTRPDNSGRSRDQGPMAPHSKEIWE